MKIHRWIYFPLIFILLYAFQSLLLDGELSFFWILYGAVFGFGLLLWSDYRARKISGRNDEEIYQVKQHRVVETLFSRNQTFELCKEAVSSLKRGKIKEANTENGSIRAKTGMTLWSFGSSIAINVAEITKHSSEVEISIHQIPRTVLISNGESWQIAEEISDYLKNSNLKIIQKQLNIHTQEKIDFSAKLSAKDKTPIPKN